MLLSAKRTTPGTGSYIRSPLFDGSASDGSFDRGIGLGMFAFSYANAQTNANLLFQIATNIDYSIVNSINAPDAAFSVPSSRAKLSSVRQEVVPTATTRPPFFFFSVTIRAVSSGMMQNSECIS